MFTVLGGFCLLLGLVSPTAVRANLEEGSQMNASARQILRLFQKTDVVFVGEIHWVTEQKELIHALLEENAKTHTFDTWATESVFAEDQEKLDTYFKNGNENFFSEMAHKMGWFKSLPIINIYRQLFDNQSVRVCAIDIPATSIDGVKISPEKRREILEARFKSFPKDIQELILKISGKSQDELIKSGDFYDREYMMAKTIQRCLKSGHKVLVHTGLSHTASQITDFLKESSSGNWWWTTQWLNELDPQIRFLVVHNTINVSTDDAETVAYQTYFQSSGAKNPFLIPSGKLPDNVKQAEISFDDGLKKSIQDWSQADFLVIGPQGHEDKKLSLPLPFRSQ